MSEQVKPGPRRGDTSRQERLTAVRSGRDLKLFGSLLREARIRQSLSQERLAAAIGVRQVSLSAWERGDAEAEREFVYQLEDLLQLDPGTLSTPLNYSRVTGQPKARGRRETITPAPQAILRDPKLTDAAKDVLIRNYKLLIRLSRWTDVVAVQDVPAA